MQSFSASEVNNYVDMDYGEGSIRFVWPDPIFGWEQLEIDADGFCSRRMPIHSGNGPPAFVELERDRIVLRFSAELAQDLQLQDKVEIRFSLSDADFGKLRTLVDWFRDR